MSSPRDHGGGLDAAISSFGGTRADWLDLSTGINPVPYPLPRIESEAWTALPDAAALERLEARARAFWGVPRHASVLAVPGASAAIARLPYLRAAGRVAIPGPTYNEHGAAFRAAGWELTDETSDALVVVNPNNPDGLVWTPDETVAPFTIIDESFCDISPSRSLIELASREGTVVLKSFGKFWGLAGVRLGFVIGDPTLIEPLREALGPWAVSGPAAAIGAEALSDPAWADETRARLRTDAARLDALVLARGARLVGGTPLFRLYEVQDAAAAQRHLAIGRVWSRIFPYSKTWLRLGLPHPDHWGHLDSAF